MNSRNDAEFHADVTFVDVPSDLSGADPLAFFESESESESGSEPQPEPQPEQENDRTMRGSDDDTAPGSIEAAVPSAGLARVRGPVALDQVLHRLGRVTWAEAVAIVEGLCGVLISSGRERVPEMSRIAITAEGGVAVATGGIKEAAGPILARMLHSMAAAGSVPAPLRLFVTKWASASDKHSIAEFVKELGYFARPDGQSLIQAVYERAVPTFTVPVSVPVLAPVPVQPQPRPPQPRPEAPRRAPPVRRSPAPGSRLLYSAAAAVVVLAIGLAAFFAWRGTGAPAQSSSTSGSTTTVPSVGSEVEVNLASVALVETEIRPQGPGSPPAPGSGAAAASTPVPGTAARATRTPPTPSVRPGVGAARAPARPPVSSAVRATLASPAATSPRSVPTLPALDGAPQRSALGATPARATRRDVATSPIYSPSDSDVTPPVFLQPQLPAQLLSGLRPDMNTLELIVSETGTVERVRLLSTPKRMPDMMLLSGAKNWEFEPALKDGQSVRYRLELSWAATP